MGLASALSTSLTGLTAAETTIDVVGNNLANSNTVGFKSSQAMFASQFLQTQSLGSQPTSNSGGTNPRQLGLGTMIAEITPSFNQGTVEISSNPNDIAIQGDGFFMVEGQGGETLYTRNGIFKFNSQNEMVNLTGNRLLGFGVDEQFQIQTTEVVPIVIPLGMEEVAKATESASITGGLSPEGDIATAAERVQTGMLGDALFTSPTTSSDTDQSSKASDAAILISSQAGGSMTPGADYEYRIIYANGQYSPPPPSLPPAFSEGIASDVISASVDPGDGSIQLNGLPSDGTGNYDWLRVYRRTVGGAAEFQYVNEVAMGTISYTDGAADAGLGPALDDTLLSGNYSYYVTFEKNGDESRPSPISNPTNVVNGRVVLKDIPTGDATEWDNRRIYRNLATDSGTFHLVGEIAGVTDPSVTFTDNLSDAEISANATIDLDGPRIIPSTLLVNVRSRDGARYDQVFQEGVLEFTGSKGGKDLATKEFQIDSGTTVQDLISFMEDAMGIQPGTADPVNPIPPSTNPDDPTEPATDSGGAITADGRIILTGNNGLANAIDIEPSDLLLRTFSGTQNVELPWQTLQSAVGESAVTDFLAYDSLGIALNVRLSMVMESRDSVSTTYRWFADSADNDPAAGSEIAVGTGVIAFDGEGNFLHTTDSTVSIDRRNISSVSPLEFQLDFSQISGLSTDKSWLAVSRQDGSAPGVLSSYLVGEGGTIRGVFSNGVNRDLGQIRLAQFANPAGLEQRGQNLFSEGINSGLPVQGNPGDQGIGSLISGALELSNTDIGGNLIDLILASTMYRGNTRVITTVQEMIDELLALRR